MFVCYQVTIQSVSSSSTAMIVSLHSLHSWQTWSHGGTCPSRGWRDRELHTCGPEAEQSDTGSCWLCSTSSTARSSDTNQPPAYDLVFSADIGENIAKYLAHIGQIVQISQLREVSLLTRDSSKFPKPMDEKITYRNSHLSRLVLIPQRGNYFSWGREETFCRVLHESWQDCSLKTKSLM